jgi:predicted transcriptional regulator
MTTPDDYLVCQICGEKFKTLSNTHLKKHNITPEEYKLKYGIKSLMSNSGYNKNKLKPSIKNDTWYWMI